VIISRTPLRITLGGGGTDLPSYYEQFGGLVLTAAINRYVYVAINRTFTDDYFLKYSALERVDKIEEIEHPIIREALRLHPIGPSIELVSVADIPAGTGLGSSGTFTVGLLKSIYAFVRQTVTPEQLASEACHIEMNILDRPVGKQDQYASSYGGLESLRIDP
jgi:D-glycero-alpha-D-manno-heptose-7-phosphate kinase